MNVGPRKKEGRKAMLSQVERLRDRPMSSMRAGRLVELAGIFVALVGTSVAVEASATSSQTIQ